MKKALTTGIKGQDGRRTDTIIEELTKNKRLRQYTSLALMPKAKVM